MKHLILMSAITVFLVACGGNGASSDNVNQSNGSPTVAGENSIVVIGEPITTAQAVELVLFFPNDELSNIHWRQTAGAAVNFLAAKSKVIAFTPTSAGDYTFEVTFSVNGGSSKTLTQTVTVSDTVNIASARLGHSVLAGNKVSLRAWSGSGATTQTIKWRQISGPSVALADSNDDSAVIFFTAPTVTQDRIIEFELTITEDGVSHRDHLGILVENADPIGNNAYFDERVAAVFPYRAISPYADSLVNCVYSNTLISSCRLSQLPLIAQETTSPTINDILNRVVVSHQWMGDRFKYFLEHFDPNNDVKKLLRATTAIVISYDVRPSFYWAATGAIYLDANNFWITPDERDTINEAPDYRAAFGDELQFVMPWRYVKNNQYASVSTPADARTARSDTDGLYRLTSLMFHELAHANDFFPATEWFGHSDNIRVLDAALATGFESDELAISYPLQSQTMRNLAQVSFAGQNATSLQKSYQPEDIASFFAGDGATDYYNYSSEREDYAMLFEELMMFTRYGIQRDVAITNNPQGDIVYANDYIVTWGQRGRSGETAIKPRINFVAARVLPELDSTTAINALPAPIDMIPGNDWIKNLTLATTVNGLSTSAEINSEAVSSNAERLPVDDAHRYYHKALPKH